MRFRLVMGAFAVMLWTTGAVVTMQDLVGNELLETIDEGKGHTTGMLPADRAYHRALDCTTALGESIICRFGTQTHKIPTSSASLDRSGSPDYGSSDAFSDDTGVILTVVATASDLEGPTPYEKATSTKQITTEHISSMIAPSSFDQQSQPVVATTEAPSPVPDGLTCDANGNCVFPPFCTVHFGEYIMCEGEEGYTAPSLTKMAATFGSPTLVDATISSTSQSLAHKSGKGSTSSIDPTPAPSVSSNRINSKTSNAATSLSAGRSTSSTALTSTRRHGEAATSTVYVTQAITVTVIAQPIISVYGASDSDDHNTVPTSKLPSIAVLTSTSAADVSKDIQLAVRKNILAALSITDGTQSANDTIDTEHALRVAKRQDVSVLVAAIEAAAALENTTDVIRERDALGQQGLDGIVEVWSTVTASPSVVYVNEATATSAYNVTGIVYETQTQAVSDIEPVTTVAIVVTKSVTASDPSVNQSTTTPTKQVISTTSTITRNITLTDPINPHITTVVPLGTSRVHFNNTSIDTDVHLNISTFSAAGLTHLSSHLTTISDALTTTSARSASMPPSMTTTTQSGDENGMVGYTPAVTSDVGKAQSSAAIMIVQVSGSCLAVLAGIALAAVLGVFMLL